MSLSMPHSPSFLNEANKKMSATRVLIYIEVIASLSECRKYGRPKVSTTPCLACRVPHSATVAYNENGSQWDSTTKQDPQKI